MLRGLKGTQSEFQFSAPESESQFETKSGGITQPVHPFTQSIIGVHTGDEKPAECGQKFDSGKPRYDLLAPEGLLGIVNVLTYGANKYADRNWEKGMAWGRVFAAAMRHLWAWWKGEEMDTESGLSHLDHAACCIHFLQTYSKRNVGKDDRRKST